MKVGSALKLLTQYYEGKRDANDANSNVTSGLKWEIKIDVGKNEVCSDYHSEQADCLLSPNGIESAEKLN